MTPKHTPGPHEWTLTDLGPGPHEWTLTDLGEVGTGGRLWLNNGDFGMFADAAPDLLSALRDVVGMYSLEEQASWPDNSFFGAARAAIAKATGNEAGR